MTIWGKIIGFMAGFAMGGPLGALLGTVAGHAYDRWNVDGEDNPAKRLGGGRPGWSGIYDQSTRRMAFTVAVIVLGAKMAKADGTVSRTEIDAFKTVFRIPPDEIKNVARIFDAARSDARGFEPYARQMAQLFRNEPSILEDLLAGLFHVARADGEINAQELNYLSKVAQHLGLEPGAFERVRSMFIQGDGIDPYGVLGIDAQTSDEDVKKTYRRLIRENHPDILVAKGMPQEFIDVANQRMAAINAAYDQIEKQRGLK